MPLQEQVFCYLSLSIEQLVLSEHRALFQHALHEGHVGCILLCINSQYEVVACAVIRYYFNSVVYIVHVHACGSRHTTTLCIGSLAQLRLQTCCSACFLIYPLFCLVSIGVYSLTALILGVFWKGDCVC